MWLQCPILPLPCDFDRSATNGSSPRLLSSSSLPLPSPPSPFLLVLLLSSFLSSSLSLSCCKLHLLWFRELARLVLTFQCIRRKSHYPLSWDRNNTTAFSTRTSITLRRCKLFGLLIKDASVTRADVLVLFGTWPLSGMLWLVRSSFLFRCFVCSCWHANLCCSAHISNRPLAVSRQPVRKRWYITAELSTHPFVFPVLCCPYLLPCWAASLKGPFLKPVNHTPPHEAEIHSSSCDSLVLKKTMSYEGRRSY